MVDIRQVYEEKTSNLENSQLRNFAAYDALLNDLYAKKASAADIKRWLANNSEEYKDGFERIAAFLIRQDLGLDEGGLIEKMYREYAWSDEDELLGSDLELRYYHPDGEFACSLLVGQIDKTRGEPMPTNALGKGDSFLKLMTRMKFAMDKGGQVSVRIGDMAFILNKATKIN